jgi:Skp family chaperone for outer membrane proteins
MKPYWTLLLASVFFTCLTQGAHAQGKIATIDLRHVFDKYHKTIAGSVSMKEEAAEVKQQLTAMVDRFRNQEQEFRTVRERSNDQALTSEERERNKRAAEQMLVGLRAREEDIRRFEEDSERRLGETNRRKRDQIVQEIREVIKARAKAAGYSLVLDTSAEGLANTPVVIFSTGENDLTEPVLQQLNASAPPGALKPLEPRPNR